MTATPDSTSPMHADDVAAIDELRAVYEQLRAELGRIIVGQTDVIERLAICLFSRGHALLMGVPVPDFVRGRSSRGPSAVTQEKMAPISFGGEKCCDEGQNKGWDQAEETGGSQLAR